jgi:ParB family chromosome partitioning protein
MLLDGTLSFGHAKVLAGLAGDADRQLLLAKRVLAETLSVRQLETLASAPPALADQLPPTRPPRMKAAYLRDLEEQLTQAVGARVTILPGRAKHTGKLLIEYYSLDDFDRLAAKLGVTVES